MISFLQPSAARAKLSAAICQLKPSFSSAVGPRFPSATLRSQSRNASSGSPLSSTPIGHSTVLTRAVSASNESARTSIVDASVISADSVNEAPVLTASDLLLPSSLRYLLAAGSALAAFVFAQHTALAEANTDADLLPDLPMLPTTMTPEETTAAPSTSTTKTGKRRKFRRVKRRTPPSAERLSNVEINGLGQSHSFSGIRVGVQKTMFVTGLQSDIRRAMEQHKLTYSQMLEQLPPQQRARYPPEAELMDKQLVLGAQMEFAGKEAGAFMLNAKTMLGEKGAHSVDAVVQKGDQMDVVVGNYKYAPAGSGVIVKNKFQVAAPPPPGAMMGIPSTNTTSVIYKYKPTATTLSASMKDMSLNEYTLGVGQTIMKGLTGAALFETSSMQGPVLSVMGRYQRSTELRQEGTKKKIIASDTFFARINSQPVATIAYQRKVHPQVRLSTKLELPLSGKEEPKVCVSGTFLSNEMQVTTGVSSDKWAVQTSLRAPLGPAASLEFAAQTSPVDPSAGQVGIGLNFGL